MPGTQLQVLVRAPPSCPSVSPRLTHNPLSLVQPVGLGVFSAVSVIALAVVGIVTYERRKYRRMYRSRRDAEKAEQEGAQADGMPGFVPIPL